MCGGSRCICAARYELWITTQPPSSARKPPCGDPPSWDPVMSSGAGLMFCPVKLELLGPAQVFFISNSQCWCLKTDLYVGSELSPLILKYFNLFLLKEEGNDLPLLLRVAIEYLTFPSSSPSAHHALCHPEKHTARLYKQEKHTPFTRAHGCVCAAARTPARASPLPRICRRFDYRAPWR